MLAAIFFGVSKATAIEDWFRLRNYSPPAAIAKFSNEVAMTPYATHVFYVTHPKIETNLQLFSQECTVREQSIVLGCYRGGLSADSNLFIRLINDDRLNGVEEVTAAHEMLHASYDRLNSKDKSKVDAMLVDFYNNDLKDQRVLDTINAYKKSEPNDVVNEMHSVFGTEIANLPAPLETYYKKYFTDRSKVTAFAANYEGEFTNRTAKIQTDDLILANQKARIQDEESSLGQQLSNLQSERINVENSNSQSAVNNYNAQVNAYNAGVRRLQVDIAAYNQLVAERNSIAEELQSLQSSLDTRLTTQSSQ